MGVIYFVVCLRKQECKLPTNEKIKTPKMVVLFGLLPGICLTERFAQQGGRKHKDMQKNVMF